MSRDMRDLFNETPTSQHSAGGAGRRLQHLFTRPAATYSHQVAMPHPAGPYGRRREWFFVGDPRNSGLRQRRRRRWPSSSTLCCYIAAVVLLQNALMAYNVARSSELDETVDNRTTTTTNGKSRAVAVISPAVHGGAAVSYTHLTLPTILRV